MITPDADGSTAAWDWYFDKVKYDGTNEYARASIAATLAQLPEEVAAWAGGGLLSPKRRPDRAWHGGLGHRSGDARLNTGRATAC